MANPTDGSHGIEPSPDSTDSLPADAYALGAGYVLNEYAIESVLGSGGFGITYLASDRNLKLKVALKEYLPADIALRLDGATVHPKSSATLKSFQWGLKRFLDEARALAAFNHPNIVRVLRFFEANATAYMVMEYIEGAPLRDWLAQRASLTQDMLTAFVAPLLDGLSAIHKAGYLHRDIKPGNIHIRSDGVPVLLDFGAARQLSGEPGQELTAILTPGYAPFEQYHSHGKQGAWSDVYSLAGVLYLIVTGTRPLESAARVREDPMPSALQSGDRRLYSESLLRAIDWGLTPSEDQRPQTVAEWRRALLGEAAPVRAAAEPATIVTRAPGGPAARESSKPSQPSGPLLLDPDTLDRAERALASHIGPLASILVRRAARKTADLDSLTLELSAQIEDDSARAAFVSDMKRQRPAGDPRTTASRVVTGSSSLAPAPAAAVAENSAPPRFAPDMLAGIEAELARHIGPLAKVLVKKAAQKARDTAELYLLLADNIVDETERKAFIRKSLQAFRERR